MMQKHEDLIIKNIKDLIRTYINKENSSTRSIIHLLGILDTISNNNYTHTTDDIIEDIFNKLYELKQIIGLTDFYGFISYLKIHITNEHISKNEHEDSQNSN